MTNELKALADLLAKVDVPITAKPSEAGWSGQIADSYKAHLEFHQTAANFLRDNLSAIIEQRAEIERLKQALQEAETHFGPFADITINGAHDPDDVRVVALIRDALNPTGEA